MSAPIFFPRLGLQRSGQLFPAQSRLFFSNHARSTFPSRPRFSPVVKAIGLSGLGVGLSLYFRPAIRCEEPAFAAKRSPDQVPQSTAPPPPPPESSVSLYELGFGTVAGLCAGVFIKKGVKTVAFLLGGVFVVLQYLGSFSLLRVNWTRVGERFESLFYTTDASGTKKAPTVWTAWNWLVDFLTADFQPRASFIAGLLLGLRIG